MSVEALVALYGAVAGTIALLVQLREHLNKRGVLRLHAKINQVRDTPEKPWVTHLVIEVTNVGNVPLLVRRVGIEVGEYWCESPIDELMAPGQMFR